LFWYIYFFKKKSLKLSFHDFENRLTYIQDAEMLFNILFVILIISTH
jgi:hypothetical protein